MLIFCVLKEEGRLKIHYYNKDKLLLIEIMEEIDHHNAIKVRTRLDFEIEKYIPKYLVLDFTNVSFMDSSGIGMLIGRYKLISMFRW